MLSVSLMWIPAPLLIQFHLRLWDQLVAVRVKLAVLCQVIMATFNSDEVDIVVTNNLNVLNYMVFMLNVIIAAEIYDTGKTGSGSLVINGKGISIFL